MFRFPTWDWSDKKYELKSSVCILYFFLFSSCMYVGLHYLPLFMPFFSISSPLPVFSPSMHLTSDWFNWKSYIQLMKYRKVAVHYIISKATLTLLFLMFCVLKVPLDETPWLRQCQIKRLKSWWWNGFIWLVTEMVGEKRDQKNADKSWSWQLSQFQTLSIYFCTVHMFLYCSEGKLVFLSHIMHG